MSHEPLHLAWWNVTRTLYIDNFYKPIEFQDQRSRSHKLFCVFVCMILWYCGYPRAVLSLKHGLAVLFGPVLIRQYHVKLANWLVSIQRNGRNARIRTASILVVALLACSCGLCVRCVFSCVRCVRCVRWKLGFCVWELRHSSPTVYFMEQTVREWAIVHESFLRIVLSFSHCIMLTAKAFMHRLVSSWQFARPHSLLGRGYPRPSFTFY